MADLDRREFMAASAGLAGGVGGGPKLAAAAELDRRQILNFNPAMEYRRLGKTGLTVSAVCLGGHWKRLATMMGGSFRGEGYLKQDDENLRNPAFLKNRSDIVTRAMEVGINYVDACSPQEILAYSKVLRGRRDKMYFGFSWHTREPRYPEWRSAAKLLEGLDLSLKEAGLDYIDLWRISLPMEGVPELDVVNQVEEATVEALARARQQGKVRFTGVSSHNRQWLKYLIEHYPDQIQVVLFPYTANSKQLPDDSVFDAVRKHNVGVFGIKPFADNSLFTGDSSLASPAAAEDDRKARLAIRYILGNPAITAPIPGLINVQQVDNVAKAVAERRKLDRAEKAELEEAGRQMWANLRPGYEWLRDWQYV